MEMESLTPQEIVNLYAGDYGYWQIRTLIIASMVKIPAAWQMASILFAKVDPNDWCIDSEVNGEEDQDPCLMYAYNSFDDEWIANFSNIPRKLCTRFENDSTSTTLDKWDFLCERNLLVSLTQFFYLLGILVGAIVAPYVIKRFGPRHIMLISIIVHIIFGVLSAYSPVHEVKFLFRFIVAYACSHMFAASFNICTGIVHSTAKTVFCCFYETFWSFGIITLPVLSYFFPGWTELQIVIPLPLYLILMLFRWVPQSPQWLLMQGMYSDAKDLLEMAANLNGREVPDLNLESCLNSSNQESGTWVEFVKTCTCTRFVSLHLCWAFTFLAYYGYFVNLNTLVSHLRIITIAAGLSEIVGISLGLLLLLLHKKKWVILGVTLITVGSSTTLCWIGAWKEIYHDRTNVTVAGLGLMARVATAISFTLLIIASTDIFEKRFHMVAQASCTIFAKAVLLCAPFLKATAIYGGPASLTAFGAVVALNGVSTLVFSLAQP